jgi:hypothetical protein
LLENPGYPLAENSARLFPASQQHACAEFNVGRFEVMHPNYGNRDLDILESCILAKSKAKAAQS